jgi:phosphoribosylglycinamide formyltransferase-1
MSERVSPGASEDVSRKKRVGILISGGGSNMAALIAAAKAVDYPAEFVVVISNKASAGGLEKARAEGIATAVVDHRNFGSREDFDRVVHAELEANRVDLICLAGFMRILSPWFSKQWTDRMLNIHPALLPSYTGLHTHARALKDGVKIHGCTVHFVRVELDVGPIIMQAAVPVLDNDTEATLAARVLAEEHRIYPSALRLVASGRAKVVARADGGEVVRVEGANDAARALVVPAITGTGL